MTSRTTRTAAPLAEPISLQEAASRLGVHYMTAYRYVRTGRLPARRDGAQWFVDVAGKMAEDSFEKYCRPGVRDRHGVIVHVEFGEFV